MGEVTVGGVAFPVARHGRPPPRPRRGGGRCPTRRASSAPADRRAFSPPHRLPLPAHHRRITPGKQKLSGPIRVMLEVTVSVQVVLHRIKLLTCKDPHAFGRREFHNVMGMSVWQCYRIRVQWRSTCKWIMRLCVRSRGSIVNHIAEARANCL